MKYKKIPTPNIEGAVFINYLGSEPQGIEPVAGNRLEKKISRADPQGDYLRVDIPNEDNEA